MLAQGQEAHLRALRQVMLIMTAVVSSPKEKDRTRLKASHKPVIVMKTKLPRPAVDRGSHAGIVTL